MTDMSFVLDASLVFLGAATVLVMGSWTVFSQSAAVPTTGVQRGTKSLDQSFRTAA